MAEKPDVIETIHEAGDAIPSNEEIIEEVTKDLKSVLINKPNDRNTVDDTNVDSAPGDSSTDIPEGFDSSDVEESVKKDDDFIDEEALKDAELTLTEEEKSQLRADAENHKITGNDYFKAGDYKESASSYTLGLRTCPLAYPKDRAIMFSNRAAAKMKLGLNPSAADDCSKAVELDSTYLKAYFRRAQVYEETDKLDEALADYQTILRLDPLHREALYATKRLPEKIQERNEKLKSEMFSKLKDLGNMILRPFNLSTENFQLTQDPSTGGYSVNFKQDPR